MSIELLEVFVIIIAIALIVGEETLCDATVAMTLWVLAS
jgi:hypothetical protein